MKKGKIRVEYRIDYEVTPGDNYSWSNGNDNILQSVMADWNGQSDYNSTPMSSYLIESLRNDNKEVPSNLILDMDEYDEENFIINFESDVDIDQNYLKDWLVGQFSDGFGEHEFSKTSKWIRGGTNGWNESDVLTITEKINFMIPQYHLPHQRGVYNTGDIKIHLDEVK